MTGGMQDRPLLVTGLLDHAAREHGQVPVVTLWVDGRVERGNWAEVGAQARAFADALRRAGIAKGDRVATLAMNHAHHLVAWYGAAGAGAVLHTINPRLFDEQLIYIVNHAADRLLFVDLAFLPIVQRLRERWPTIERIILMDGPGDAGAGVEGWDEFIATGDAAAPWTEVAERDPCGLCYTSGTTGNPKGVLYENRSNVIHALTEVQPDVFDLSARATILPIVPMFHANAWGVPFAAALVGARLVLSATNDAAALWRIIRAEGVTHTAGVPTVFLALFAQQDAEGAAEHDYGALRHVVIGGSAAPRAMIERFMRAGIHVAHAWGMTETSPIGTMGTRPADWEAMAFEDRVDLTVRQGRAPFGVELRLVDDAGAIIARDGRTSGRLQVRGPWVVGRYFQAEQDATDAEGWFDTGDIAIIDPDGTMRITDRAKDVIKSGGEWISSIDLENAAIGAPGVAEAAAVGVAHPRWDERPLLLVVPRPGASIDEGAIRAHLADRIAKWWMPDDIVTVAELPHTATGKILKRQLREDYANYVLSALREGQNSAS